MPLPARGCSAHPPIDATQRSPQSAHADSYPPPFSTASASPPPHAILRTPSPPRIAPSHPDPSAPPENLPALHFPALLSCLPPRAIEPIHPANAALPPIPVSPHRAGLVLLASPLSAAMPA